MRVGEEVFNENIWEVYVLQDAKVRYSERAEEKQGARTEPREAKVTLLFEVDVDELGEMVLVRDNLKKNQESRIKKEIKLTI